MKEKTRLEKRLSKKARDDGFLFSQALLKLTIALEQAMAEEGMNRTALAKKLGVNKSYVTRVLNGEPNLTLRTLVRFANALNRKVELAFGEFELGAQNTETEAAEVSSSKKPRGLSPVPPLTQLHHPTLGNIGTIDHSGGINAPTMPFHGLRLEGGVIPGHNLMVTPGGMIQEIAAEPRQADGALQGMVPPGPKER